MGRDRNSLLVVQCWMRIAGFVDDSDPDEAGGLEGDPDHYAGPGTAALRKPFGVEELAEYDY